VSPPSAGRRSKPKRRIERYVVKHTVFLAVLVLMAASPLGATEGRDTEFLRQGKALFAEGRYRKAAQAFEEAGRLNPGSTEALNGAGMSYQKLGANETAVNEELLERAMAAFNKALSIDPRQAVTRYNLGMAYLALHRMEDAVKQCDALKEMDKALAQTLSARIDEYRPAQKYRSIGSSGRQSARVERGGGQAVRPKAPQRFAGTVEVYGADWCPHCRKAKRYMIEKGISFVYHNIEEDAAAKSAYQSLGGGGIPLIVIGGNKMHGFSAESLEYYLSRSQ
jgi:glutaredoxin